MKYKATCIKASIKVSGIMFIKDESYEVEKFKNMTLNKYVVVEGLFNNSHNEKRKLKRVIAKDICYDHLKIVD